MVSGIVSSAASSSSVSGASMNSAACGSRWAWPRRILSAAHGVTAKATSNEKSMAALEPIGIGRM